MEPEVDISWKENCQLTYSKFNLKNYNRLPYDWKVWYYQKANFEISISDMWIFVAETFCNANIDINEKRENEKLYLTKLLKTYYVIVFFVKQIL